MRIQSIFKSALIAVALITSAGHAFPAPPSDLVQFGGPGPASWIQDVPLKAVAVESFGLIGLKNDGSVIQWGFYSERTPTPEPPVVSGVKAIAAEDRAVAAALKEDGTVVAWNGWYNMDLSYSARLSDVVAIDVDNHIYALKRDGTLVSPWDIPIQTELIDVVSIAVRYPTILALKRDGSLVAWSLTEKKQVQVPTGVADVISISAYSNRFVALKSGGVAIEWTEDDPVHVTEKFRIPGAVSIAYGGYLAVLDDGSVEWNAPGVTAWEFPGRNSSAYDGIISLVQGPNRTVAIKSDGSVMQWGFTWGDDSLAAKLHDVQSIAVGGAHVLALRKDGTVFSWGSNVRGELDLSYAQELGRVREIGAGADFSVALMDNGTLVSSGCRNILMMVSGPGVDDCLKEDLSRLTNIAMMAVGPDHTVAQTFDGEIVQQGRDVDSALVRQEIPTWWPIISLAPVPRDLNHVKALAAGLGFSVALKNDGTVVAWGLNDYGQTDVPAGLTDVVSIAAGYAHVAALKKDGSVVAWGANKYGQTNVPQGLKARAIFAGGQQTWALRDTAQGIGVRPRHLSEQAGFRPGLVRLRNTAGKVIWQGMLESLNEASRIQPGQQVLLVEHLELGKMFRVVGLR